MNKKRRFDAEFAAMSAEDKDAFNELLATIFAVAVRKNERRKQNDAYTGSLTKKKAEAARIDRTAAELLSQVDI
jgi:hypothetical protein